MTAVIVGAGWVMPGSCGVADGLASREYPGASGETLFAQEALVAGPIKNFGRFPRCARDLCAACALALRAARIAPCSEDSARVGIVAAGLDGVMAVNREYFADYVANGRVMGRGNLFIYTTPSSPVAEASILLGIRGPMVCVDADTSPCAELLRTAAELLCADQAEAMACVWQDHEATLCATVAPRPDAGPDLPLEGAIRAAATWHAPADAVHYLRTMHSDTDSIKGPAL